MHKYLLIFLFTCCLNTAHAQEANDSSDEEQEVMEVPDTTLFRHAVLVPSDTIAFLKRKKEFAYVSSLDSLLEAKQKADATTKKNAVRSLSFIDQLLNSAILKGLFWLLVAGLVGFILYRLIITQGVFRRAKTANDVEEKEEAEKIYTQSDYSKLIQQSCRLGDYRSAVKYLFLRTLSQLSDHSYIEYAADKTNYRYLQEIPADKKKEFARLILNYEYIWYGHRAIAREIYEQVESEFTAFQKKI